MKYASCTLKVQAKSYPPGMRPMVLKFFASYYEFFLLTEAERRACCREERVQAFLQLWPEINAIT